MAFFGRSVFNDPFFGDMHRMMRNQMRDMDALLNPFGMIGGRVMENPQSRTPRQQMIEDEEAFDRRRDAYSNREREAVVPYRNETDSIMEPFGFGFGSGLLGGLMRQMEQLHSQAINDPDSQVYSQSTVMSFTPGEDGRPKYYEATESVRKAGDVKETRRSVRDPDRGVEKMEIGHHIGNRAHVIEKRRDRTTGGQIVENQQFIGIREDDAPKFDQEWSRATQRALSGERYGLDCDTSSEPQLAIEAPSRHRSRSVPRQQRNRHSGPVIEEITDENSNRHGGGFLGRMKNLFRA